MVELGFAPSILVLETVFLIAVGKKIALLF